MRIETHLIDVLAVEFSQELGQSLFVGINTDRLEKTLDVGLGRAGIATEAEEEVSCEMRHFDIRFCSMLVVCRTEDR